MDYPEARMVVVSLLDPQNNPDIGRYEAEAVEAVLEWADRYEDLRD